MLRRKLVQCVIHNQQLVLGGRSSQIEAFEIHAVITAAMAPRVLPPGPVNQNAAHCLGGGHFCGNPVGFFMNETGWCDGLYMGQQISDAQVSRPSDIIFIGEGTGDKEWNTFHIAYTTPKDVRSTTCGHNPLPNQPITLTDLYNTPGDDFGGQGFKIIYSPRHNGGNNYVFYDGHVRWMRSFLGSNWRVKE